MLITFVIFGLTAGPPKAMHLPMNSMPLLKDFSDETSDQTSDKKKSSPLVVRKHSKS